MAAHSVGGLVCLMFVAIYMFAIVFTQLKEVVGLVDVHDDPFTSIHGSMHNLLITGIFPDSAYMFQLMLSYPWPWNCIYYFLYLFYLTVCTLTLMNMVVGALCEVITSVSDLEFFEQTVLLVYDHGRRAL